MVTYPNDNLSHGAKRGVARNTDIPTPDEAEYGLRVTEGFRYRSAKCCPRRPEGTREQLTARTGTRYATRESG